MGQHIEEVAILINNKPVYKSELLRELRKDQASSTISLDSFLTSYIYYRLNLEEAYAQRLDTTLEFQKGLEPFKLGLMNQHLQDTIAENMLIDNILARFDYELEVNHALLPFDSLLVFPKDTMTYYKQAMEMRKLVQNSGFENLEANQLISSLEVIVNYEIQSGYLGWIRPLFFSQRLEEILYSLELGEITMPIRTETGYHIFQVTGKRPLKGSPIVEQLLFGFPQIPATKQMQDSVYKVVISTYDEISIKDNFQLICDEFSTAFETGDRGCLLGEIGPGAQVPLPLISAAYKLKEKGEISEPILSAYGYHILRLKDRKVTPSKEKIRASLKQSLEEKNVLPKLIDVKRQRMIDRTKSEINKGALKEILDLANKYSPKNPLFDQNIKNVDATLITIDNGAKTYSIKDFLRHKALMLKMEEQSEDDVLSMVKVQPMFSYNISTDLLQSQINSFLYTVLLRYEKETLEEKNPDYAKSLDEISKGIMFSVLQEREIWKKSKLDTKGLEDLFQQNRTKYRLPEKVFKGLVVLSKKKEVLPELEKVYQNNKEITPTELRKTFNNSGLTITVERGVWQEGMNPYVDNSVYGIKNNPSSNIFPYFSVLGQFISEPQDYSDVRSEVEADYQKILEKGWKNYLNNKYKVEINDAVIKSIK